MERYTEGFIKLKDLNWLVEDMEELGLNNDVIIQDGILYIKPEDTREEEVPVVFKTPIYEN